MAEIYNEKVHDLFTEINSKQNERTALKIENCKGMLYIYIVQVKMKRSISKHICNAHYINHLWCFFYKTSIECSRSIFAINFTQMIFFNSMNRTLLNA